jgi:hypothetical protein
VKRLLARLRRRRPPVPTPVVELGFADGSRVRLPAGTTTAESFRRTAGRLTSTGPERGALP